MKNRVFMTVIIQLIAIGLMLGSLGSPALARTVLIRSATFYPAKNRLVTDAFTVWSKEIEKLTKGNVKFQWYVAGSLVKAPQMQKALKFGLADLATPVTGWFPNLYPVSQGISLPFMVNSPLQAAMVLYDMYQTIPEMRKEYKDMVPVAFFTTAVEQIHVKGAPPKNITELRKFRIGCVGQDEIRFAKDLGITPLHLDLGDLYMALQRGVINGVVFPTAPTHSWKLTEILNGHTIGNFFVVPFVVGINKHTWKKISPESRKTITDLSRSFSALLGTTLLNEDKRVIAGLKSRGDKFYALTPEQRSKWKKLTQPQYDDYVKSLNKRGMNGKEILAKIQAIADEWVNKSYAPDSWWGRAGKR